MPASSRSALPLVALATGVLVLGAGAATSLAGSAQPVLADKPVPMGPYVPPPSSASASAKPAPQPVPLVVRPAARTALKHDPGDPATWSTRQLAAQVVFSCVNAADLPTAVAHAKAGIGGIVVMGRPTNGRALTDGLARVRAAAPHRIAPLIASDEEGGRVQRLKGLLGPLPSAAVMGRWPDARIEQTAHRYGTGMRRLGVQLALSPVADVAARGGYPAATERAFSADPNRVSRAAVAWSRGLQRAGVLSAVKHWPGHGHAKDSHTAAPAVPPLAALERNDLRPFDAVMKSGASLVMVGHLRSAGLTEPGLPATLSPNAMRVLRKRAGPATVLLTDSVSMAAASSALGLRVPQAAARALRAGADWAMTCQNPVGAVNEIAAALDRGHLSRKATEASARRILAVKQRLGLLGVPPTTAPPTGAIESAQLLEGVVTLIGRAVDPDGAAPPRVQVSVGRAVVADVLPDAATRAFSVAVPALPGSQLCLVARNTGAGRSTPLGCVTLPR